MASSPITKSPLPILDEAERSKPWIYGILLAGFGSLSYYFSGRWYAQACLACVVGYVISKRGYYWIYLLYKTFPRDISGIIDYVRTTLNMRKWEREDKTVLKVFLENVQKYPEKVAFHIEGQAWTFKQLDDFSNKVAWYYKNQGYKRGDIIALIMETRPDYVGMWLGLAKLGVVSALININLRADILIHSIKAASAKAIIFSGEYASGIEEIQDHVDIKDLTLYLYSSEKATSVRNATNITDELESMPVTPHLESVAAGKFKDNLIYIYTSGTTGFPKPAIITNSRFMMIAFGLSTMCKVKLDDVVYDPLPLYHTAGGCLGAGQAIVMARTVVLRKKFSASNFWKDCIQFNCTAAQYIGETCRYLLAQPPNELERKHKVRMMFGNGLRPQIWRQFVDRFGISNIKEFYGATEGNTNMINLPSKEGAVGFCCRFDNGLYPMVLVRCDEATGEILKDKDGFCVHCQPFEAGVVMGKVIPKKAILAFSGYADKSATEKKLVRDVFTKGDCYFNSGDILIMDHYGFFYFKDRTGDTFRWKGENVSTSEVEAAMSKIVGLKDIIVYGIQVPETEGRAGMAAIVDPAKKLDVSDLAVQINKVLPAYARPLFLRILMEPPLTATFKLRKVGLVEEAFDMDKVIDDLYFLDPKLGYVPMTRSLHDDICSGKVRL